ncbi:MAG: glycosyltransferase [Bacteroidia bacterium]|nr:glycosyltransferase [Bacteroidia bacterium]
MKIVIVGPAHPLRGGLAAYNERIAKAFIDAGHQVVIYTFSMQYPKLLFPGKSQYSNQPPPSLNIKVCINSINPFNWIKVAQKIKKENADILLVKFWLPFMAPCFGTINRLGRTKNKTTVVSIIDNIIPHEKRLGDKILANYFVKSVDGFIAMSQSVLTDLQKFDNSKPKLFSPHPLYDNFGPALNRPDAIKHLGLDPQFEYILFFGFIRPYKGLEVLLEAMANTEIKSRNIKLIVAGEFYTDRAPYDALIEKHQLQQTVLMHTDFIPDDKVRYYFCASHLVVQPYTHATQSGVTQICYHFNIPMLVTNVGGLPEMVPHNQVGYIAQPDAADVAHYILKYFDENKEQNFVQNIIQYKTRYDWQVMVDKVFEIASLHKNKYK